MTFRMAIGPVRFFEELSRDPVAASLVRSRGVCGGRPVGVNMSGYWDLPEGQDCFRKIWLAGRVGAATGLIGAAYHIVLYPSETTLDAVRRAASSTVLMATLGAVFAATSCISAELRDAPDDPMNYFIGGCASGTILGARSHSFAVGSSACIGLGALAAYVKIAKKEGWTFLGPPKF